MTEEDFELIVWISVSGWQEGIQNWYLCLYWDEIRKVCCL